MSEQARRRLGFLITNLEGGGAERVVSNLAQGLCDRSRSLLVFEDDIAYPFDGDVHVVDIPLFGPASRTEKVWKMARGVVRLSRMRKQMELDTCVSFLTWPNLLNVLSGTDERVIISVRNNPAEAIRGKFAPVLKAMMRGLYPRADHIVAISEDVRRTLIDQFGVDPGRVTTIYNPIMLREVTEAANQPLPRPLRGMERHPTVVSVGRLAVQKGQWHLVRAFRRIRDRLDDSRLVILGVGPFRDYLVDLARRLGLRVWIRDQSPGEPLDSEVIFWGFSDNPFPILAQSDVFAFPSLWEGLGNVVLESLASGVAVVSADCRSGPREILAPDTPLETSTTTPEWAEYGVLLPVCDGRRYTAEDQLTHQERVWSDVLVEMLENTEIRRRYAARGIDRARDFSLGKIVEQWRGLLAS